MNLGFLEITMVLALFAGLTSLGAGLYQFWRSRSATEQSASAEQEIATLIREGESRLAAMVSMLDNNQKSRFDNLQSDISAVRAEIDWLAGEQMIEQAIQMARDGIAPDEISAQLGMSYDAAEALKLVRLH